MRQVQVLEPTLEHMAQGRGLLEFQVGCHPHKRTFKAHPTSRPKYFPSSENVT